MHSKRKQALTSEWRKEEGRKRRFYRTSADGKEIRQALTEELQGLGVGLSNPMEITL